MVFLPGEPDRDREKPTVIRCTFERIASGAVVRAGTPGANSPEVSGSIRGKNFPVQGESSEPSKGYDSEAIHWLIREDLQADSVIPIRSWNNEIIEGTYRQEMAHQFNDLIYPRQQLVENKFSVMKRKFSGDLKARRFFIQMKEIAGKMIVCNLHRFLQFLFVKVFYSAKSNKDNGRTHRHITTTLMMIQCTAPWTDPPHSSPTGLSLQALSIFPTAKVA